MGDQMFIKLPEQPTSIALQKMKKSPSKQYKIIAFRFMWFLITEI